jgi:hypothetical protein
MSRQSQYKLPKYVFRTAFGVFRFKRNVPKDIRETVGKTFFYKVLGKDYKDAIRILDLSRFDAAACARLSHLSFESDRAFPTQC